MCLYIEQTSGKFADMARSAWQAQKDGDYDMARAIYKQATGNDVPAHITNDSCWFKYNLDMSIRTHYGKINMDDVPYHHNDDEHYYNILCKRATAKHGGTWRVQYEY